MDLELNQDQRAVRDAIAQIVARHMETPFDGERPAYWVYGEMLERELQAGDFFALALTEGFGALEAGLLVYEAARSPQVVETAGSALVAPRLFGEALPRPVAMADEAELARGVRFLDRARTLLVAVGDDVVALEAEALDRQKMESVHACPLARIAGGIAQAREVRRIGGGAATFRTLRRIGLALEIAGALQAAVDFTTDYVKQRKVFGRPVGSYQAVQHRLAIDAHKARGAYWLALKAAWSGQGADAALAALYAQEAIASVIYDTHQFNGALGMTLEHKLHFWTFRLRWLQAEMGSARSQAGEAAAQTWPEPGGP
jgi:alkylation response protein AidB-like acyl-CoA dehydrogenase